MSSESLYHPPFMGQMVVDGLNRFDDRPCLYLGDTIASYREVRERTSQFIPAACVCAWAGRSQGTSAPSRPRRALRLRSTAPPGAGRAGLFSGLA